MTRDRAAVALALTALGRGGREAARRYLSRARESALSIGEQRLDLANSISEAEDAAAATIGSLRIAEADHAAALRAAEDWGCRAVAASTKADELRAEGKAAEADRLDELAKIAIGKQISFENEARSAEPMIEAQRETVERLKAHIHTVLQEV